MLLLVILIVALHVVFFCKGQQVASIEFVKVNNYVHGHLYDTDGETLIKFVERLEDTDEGIS